MSTRWHSFAARRRRHRVTPLTRALEVRDGRGSLPMRYRVGDPSEYVFTADFYSFREHQHPDHHLGWWRFALPPGTADAQLTCAFDPLGRESVSVEAAGTRHDAIDAWWNPAFAFEPLVDLLLVMRDASGEVRVKEPVLVKLFDREILRRFYDRHYSSEGYTPPGDAPFLAELHAHKLSRLRALFERYIPPGSLVADVGCGRSLFTELDTRLPFTIVSGDLVFDSIRARAAEAPDQRWAVFDAAALPFRDRSFDALFAGEVIEHMPAVTDTLREWRRVLKPGGVAIITTPNRNRLVSLLDGIERPVSRDHLNELSYRQLTRDLLPAAGFEFVAQSSVHLELWLKHIFDDQRVDDLLQAEENRHARVGLMRRLFPLGRLFPSLALVTIVVARRRDS